METIGDYPFQLPGAFECTFMDILGGSFGPSWTWRLTWTFGSTLEQTTKPEYHSTFVLLYYLKMMAVKMIGRGGFRRWEFLTLWVSDEHEDVYEENLEADTEAEGEGDEDDDPGEGGEEPAT